MSTTKAQSPNGDVAEAVVAADDIRHIEIPQLDVRQAVLHCVGITSLITKPWSEKSAQQLEDTQMKKAKQQRSARVPEDEWKAATYIIPGKEDLPDWEPGKYFFPASAFKHVFLYGVGQMDDVKNLPKTKATGWVFLDDDPVLDFERVNLRTDIGRNPTQPIYRPEFINWSVDLLVGYNARSITIDQVVALFDLGGFAGGIGEWRPTSPKNKSGSHGRFRVERVTSR